MSTTLERFADELVTSGVTITYRYPCDQPTHTAGPAGSGTTCTPPDPSPPGSPPLTARSS